MSANAPSDSKLPTGTVTFLFTDIEGSTALWEQYPAAMPAALARHDRRLRRSIESHGGYIVKTTGDGLIAAFQSVSDALAASLSTQRELQRSGAKVRVAQPHRSAAGPIELRVRMGLHTGEAAVRDGDYFGTPLNMAARVMALAQGGQILVSAVTADLLRGRLPPGVILKDIGEHKLKGLAQPQRLLQVTGPNLADELPPPPPGTEPAVNVVPKSLTSFIGRDRELEQCARLLQHTRLLTLTGLGGTGKTRLATEVAELSKPLYSDGVYFVDLAPIGYSDRVSLAVAATLGIGEQRARSIVDSICVRLEHKRALVVLDNCEHVLAGCAAFVATLLACTSGISVLATSREPLNVPGEQIEAVGPLRVAPPRLDRAGEQSDAAQLFLSRASLVAPHWSPGADMLAHVEAICRRLEGLPLAIELAAARLKVLSIEEIHDRLNDRFHLLRTLNAAERRHQTLRGVIDWSYAQLEPQDQKALRRLSVCAAGWSLAAAAFVLSVGEYEAMDGLERLVDKSLILVDRSLPAKVRYRMLETVRDYALAQLDEAGELHEARTRHLDYFAAFAELAVTARGGVQNDEHAIEYDNLMAAHDWCNLQPAASERGLRLALALCRILRNRAHPRLARVVVVKELDRQSSDLPEALRARALLAVGDCAGDVGDYHAASKHFLDALEIARRCDDRSLAMVALWKLSGTLAETGSVDEARRYAEESLTLAQASDSPYDLGASLNQLGELCRIERKLSEAALHYEKTYVLYREHGIETINPLLNLAIVANERRDYAQAYRYFADAAAETKKRASEYYKCWLPQHAAALAAAMGDPTFAARMWGAAESIRVATGLTLQRADLGFLNPRIDLCRDSLGHARFDDACEAGRALLLDDAVAEIEAWLARTSGDRADSIKTPRYRRP